jgi:hypothetical protein
MSHSTSHCSCTLRLSALLCRSPEWSQIHTKACISSSSSSSVVGSWSSCLVTASACHREILRQRRRRRRRSSRDGPKRQQRRELFRRPVASPHVPSRPSPVRTTCSPLAVREISSHPRTYPSVPRPTDHPRISSRLRITVPKTFRFAGRQDRSQHTAISCAPRPM